jgi:hypothetical protein
MITRWNQKLFRKAGPRECDTTTAVPIDHFRAVTRGCPANSRPGSPRLPTGPKARIGQQIKGQESKGSSSHLSPAERLHLSLEHRKAHRDPFRGLLYAVGAWNGTHFLLHANERALHVPAPIPSCLNIPRVASWESTCPIERSRARVFEECPPGSLQLFSPRPSSLKQPDTSPLPRH